MRKHLTGILAAATLIAGLAAAPALYAHSPSGGQDMMGQGMMDHGVMGGAAMAGHHSGSMMGMMSGMGRNCGARTVNGGAAPNAQWQRL